MIDLIKFEIKKNEKFTHVLILQPTCPFRKIQQFIDAYKKFKKNKIDTAVTVHKLDNHPSRMIVRDGAFFKPYDENFNFKNRQNLQNVFLRTGSMYFLKFKILKNITQFLEKSFWI